MILGRALGKHCSVVRTEQRKKNVLLIIPMKIGIFWKLYFLLFNKEPLKMEEKKSHVSDVVLLQIILNYTRVTMNDSHRQELKIVSKL